MSTEGDCCSKKESLNRLRNRLKKVNVVLVNISKLKPHEKVSAEDINSLRKCLLNENGRILKFPIVCDKHHNIIIDGHCRYNVFKELKLKKIPVYYVDYSDEKIVVDCWRKGEKVTKEEVIKITKCGKCFPPKTTKHMYVSENGMVRILEVLPQINVPLDTLKNNENAEEEI
jgi:hypothetical protein